MNNRLNGTNHRFTVADATAARVGAYLEETFAGTGSMLGDLNPWTQRIISGENLAKLALVFEAEDPAEACYRDLIREIDTEAESGIYLARRGSSFPHLARVAEDRGVSGKLYQEVDGLSPIIFADEVAHSGNDLDLVWVTIEARHERAHLDATVSEIIMTHLLDNADVARDMTNAIRALHYAHHEDIVRRQCNLPAVLDDRERRDVEVMADEFAARSGNYASRADEIRQRAELGFRDPVSRPRR